MLNEVVLIGRLTADPRYSATSSGVVVAEFRLAVDRDFKNKQTNEREADFINVVAWRSTAEWVIKNATKGQLVAVKGQLRSSNWTAEDGTKHYDLKVNAEDVYFIGLRKDKPAAPVANDEEAEQGGGAE